MRYGQPTIASAVARLREAEVSRLVVLPLFPQYSDAATGSALAKLADEMQRSGYAPPSATISAFYDAPGFARSVANAAEQALRGFAADFVLFSYHGLPERHMLAGDPSGAHCLASDGCCDAIAEVNRDCYRAQCFATTRAVAEILALEPERHATAFQSRLGRTPWIQPFTDHILVALAARGIKRLAVICPSFTADCLETLEEIGIRAAEQWRDLCGGQLELIPAVNARPDWTQAVAPPAPRTDALRSNPRVPLTAAPAAPRFLPSAKLTIVRCPLPWGECAWRRGAWPNGHAGSCAPRYRSE